MNVVCGDIQTSVITIDGDVYTCGSFQSRMDEDSNIGQVYPSRISLDLPAVKVASGFTLIAVLLRDGSVFTIGTNLPTDDPFGDYEDEDEDEEEDEDDNEPLPKPSSSVPIRINLPLPAIDIACGENWVIAVLQDGSVYGWGDNIAGQLGVRNPRKRDNPGVSREDLNFRVEPVPMDLPMGQKAKAVACGFQHTIVLMEDGSVYGCGENDYSQLGLPELNPLSWSYSLLKLKLPQPVIDITCGSNTTCCITEEGEAYTYGGSDKSPRRMMIQGYVQSVAIGDYSTIVILEDDSVLTAGAVNNPRTSYPVKANVIGELATYLS
jgi:alpha-tubulin suppressor-like RCC1 family protein